METTRITQDAATPRNPAENPLVRFTLLITGSLTVMAGAIITPSLPPMQEHFADVPDVAFWVRLVLTLPALFIVLGSPIAGVIVDRFGRKGLLAGALVLYGLAGSAGYFLGSIPALLVSRALLGLAVACIMTSVTTLVADYYTGSRRALIMGQQVAFMGLGGAVYNSLGGFLADLSWRNPFLIYLASFLILPFVLLTLWEPPRVRPVDSALTGNAPTDGPDRLPVQALVIIYGIVALVQVTFYLIPVHLPFYLKELVQADGKMSGLAIAVGTLSFSVGSLLSPRIAGQMDRSALIVLSFALVAIGFALIAFATSYPVVLLGLLISGQGFGYVVPNMSVWLTTVVPPSLRGRALGGQGTAVFLGQFLSPILTQPFVHSYGYKGGYLSAAILVGALSLGLFVFQRVTALSRSAL